MGLIENGDFTIFDDYVKLETYSQDYLKAIAFCDSGEKLFITLSQANYINLWKISYSYFDTWFVKK